MLGLELTLVNKAMNRLAATSRHAPSALRITIRFLSGAPRRPSNGCNRQLSTRACSRVRQPLIRNAVRPTEMKR